MLSKLVGGVAALIIGTMSASTAQGAMVTRTFDFTVTDLIPTDDPVAAPIDPVMGSFTLTFDPTVATFNSTSGLVVNSFNLPIPGGIGFSYNGTGYLGFGGLSGGVNAATLGTDDFLFGFLWPLDDAPQLVSFSYYRDGIINSWHTTSGSVRARDGEGGLHPGGVPEPTSWVLMIAGFGAAGLMFRRRRFAI